MFGVIQLQISFTVRTKNCPARCPFAHNLDQLIIIFATNPHMGFERTVVYRIQALARLAINKVVSRAEVFFQGGNLVQYHFVITLHHDALTID